MKQLVRISGIIAFWFSWPVLYMYLKYGGERTRILLVADDKVLLVRTWHGPGDWSLPGGGIHKNEEPMLAATRELKEETSIMLGADQLQFLGENHHSKFKLHFDCQYFFADLTQPIEAIARLPEIIDARWVPRHELDDYRLAPDASYALSAYAALVQ